MTDKMRECPFCGSTAKELAEGYVSCFNHDCPLSAMSMTVDAWNTRAKVAKPTADGKGDEAFRYVKRLGGDYPDDYRKLQDSNGWWVVEEINSGHVKNNRRQFVGSFNAWKDITASEYENAERYAQAKLATVRPVEPISIGKGTKMCNVCRRIEAVCICEKPARVKEIAHVGFLCSKIDMITLNEAIDAINEMRKR